MADVVEREPQRHALFRPAQAVEGAPGLATVHPGDNLAVGDGFRADQLVDLVDIAPGALVPRAGQLVGGEVEADTPPTAARHQEAVGVALEHDLQATPGAAALVPEPQREPAEQRHRDARHRQQNQEPSHISHGELLTAFAESPQALEIRGRVR